MRYVVSRYSAGQRDIIHHERKGYLNKWGTRSRKRVHKGCGGLCGFVVIKKETLKIRAQVFEAQLSVG